MANNHFFPFLIFLCFTATSPIMLSSCAGIKKIDQIPIPFFKPKKKILSKPSPRPLSQGQEPVWIKPIFGKAWVEPHVEANGDYIGGHYVATIIEEGHWATQEEAQLTGRPYLHPDQSPPILSQPSTTLTPLPPSLDHLPAASSISLSNQLPSFTPLQTHASHLSAAYNARSEELILSGRGTNGEKFTIQTPKGPAILLFDAQEVLMTFDGKTSRHALLKDTPVRIQLHP